VSAVPPAPWQGRPAEVERTPTGEVIVRNRHGAFFQPHGERHWLPFETAEELWRKTHGKPRPRRPVVAADWSPWDA
jgi:hypothetical protein